MLKIIKTAWGSLDYVKSEVLGKAKFSNESIYVWGSDNQRFLQDLGYETKLVSESPINPEYSTLSKKYYHKLEAISLADSDFGEYLLVDWDSYPTRSLDSEFIKLLESRAEVQCPVYALPNDFFKEISKFQMSNDQLEFFSNQNELIKDFSWKFGESRVIPNFSFFYSRNAKIGNSLMNIAVEQNLLSNVEEFALHNLIACSLTDYIESNEPLVAIGQASDSLPSVNQSLSDLNSFVNSKVNKITYISHK